MNANTPNSAVSAWPRNSEGTMQASRPVADAEVPMPKALNPLATATDSETLKEAWRLMPLNPSAQHSVAVTIIDLEPQAENGTTDWLAFFPPERDRVSSTPTSGLDASPQRSTRSGRDTLQARRPGSFVFVPIPPPVLPASSRPAARSNEQSLDTIVTPARSMRFATQPIRAALRNVSNATRIVIKATRTVLDVPRRSLQLLTAIRLRLTSGSHVSRRAHRVAAASAIAMALAATFVYLRPPTMSNDDLASLLRLVPSPQISSAAALVRARDSSSGLSIEASRSGIGARGNALRPMRLAAAALPSVQKAARSDVKRPAASVPLVAPSSGAAFRGALLVTSEPAGAEVSINGVSRGRTPLVIQSLPAGNRIVRLDLPGYDRWSRSVGVVANTKTSVSVTLRPEAGPFVAKTAAAAGIAHNR